MAEHYVTNDAWLRQVGRPDLVDEIADQFERPVAAGREAFWMPEERLRWPRTPRAWRSLERWHSGVAQRRAG